MAFLPTRDDQMVELARRLREHFSGRDVPRLGPLTQLFRLLFFTSLCTDEARPVRCSIAVADPSRVIEHNPNLVRSDRWTITRFDTPIHLTVDSLSKLAQAIRPNTAALAVWLDQADWLIWGMIDQEQRVDDFRRRIDDHYYPRAGRFQVEITDVACLSIYHDSALLVHLHRDRLISTFQDVLHGGPVRRALEPLLDEHERKVVEVLEEWSTEGAVADPPIGVPVDFVEHLLKRSREDWINALSRILLSIQRLGHGGALLVLREPPGDADLKVKYGVRYDRLQTCLLERGASRLMKSALNTFGIGEDGSEVAKGVRHERDTASRREDDARRAEQGAAELIASLTGVDGLVLAVGGLCVTGFGVEITTKTDPTRTFSVTDADARQRVALDPSEFGTRHRSMMRYCFAHPRAVGFVISQDGDVRAMTRIGRELNGLEERETGRRRTRTIRNALPGVREPS